MLPPVTVPFALTVPVTFTPAVVNTATLLVPPIVMLALPLADWISKLVVPFWIRSPRMLPCRVALPLTVKLPWISTSPGLMVITVVPATLPRMLPPLETIAIFDVPLVIAVLLMFPPKMLPLTLRSPVTLTCAAVSLAVTTALPEAFEMLVTLVVTIKIRTSITSPAAGASVNVNVVVLIEYAVVGIC